MSGSEAVVNNESEKEVVLRKSIDDWRKRGPAPWKLGRVLVLPGTPEPGASSI
jgi:hypothetical protein